jgi:hypothetical protein
MRPIFPRWSTAVFRWGLLAVAITLVGVPVLLMGWVRTQYVTGQYAPIEQPVLFDHRHHVVDDRIDCRYCHRTVETSSTAGYPPAGLCMNCHSQIWNESPLLEPVRKNFYAGIPVVWRRVNRLPDFVFFNHAAHVNNGVGCETCHGRVDMMPYVYQVAPLTMGWCLSCHRNPEPRLRPLSAITTMGWKPDGEALRAERPRVHPGQSCTTCHR